MFCVTELLQQRLKGFRSLSLEDETGCMSPTAVKLGDDLNLKLWPAHGHRNFWNPSGISGLITQPVRFLLPFITMSMVQSARGQGRGGVGVVLRGTILCPKVTSQCVIVRSSICSFCFFERTGSWFRLSKSTPFMKSTSTSCTHYLWGWQWRCKGERKQFLAILYIKWYTYFLQHTEQYLLHSLT